MANSDPLLKRFGAVVRLRRQALSMSQETLAEKADIDPSYLGGIERGTRNPTLIVISHLASALEVEMAFFFQQMDVLDARLVGK